MQPGVDRRDDLAALRDDYLPLYADSERRLEDIDKLDHLALYFMAPGNRGPVEGWSELWGTW